MVIRIKMILRPVVIFLLCCHSTKGKVVENISIESVFNQVAVPTKIINEFLHQPIKKESSKNHVLNKHIESSTVHYENANGFVPLIIPADFNEFQQKKEASKILTNHPVHEAKMNRTKSLEDDPLFSTEARAFFNLPNSQHNRRSLNLNNNPDEFELLKVNNGTPAIANYNLFYNQSKSILKPNYSQSQIVLRKSLRNKDRERGGRTQSYLGNYDAKNEEDNQYGSPSLSKEFKRNNHYTNNLQNHYKQETMENYHSQRTSLPKSNFASITTPKSNKDSFSTIAKKSEETKLKAPIMVKPSEYKIDLKYTGQSVQSTVSTSKPQSNFIALMDSVLLENETSERSVQTHKTNRNYEPADSRDFSSEYLDYTDEFEKPRRAQKLSRKRPTTLKSSRKLPKEHREIYDEIYDEHGKKHSRSKSRHRQKPKHIHQSINEEDHYDNEGDNSDENTNTSYNPQNLNKGNTWKEVTPNIEVSHSNGYEIDQIEKPKLHLVPINVISNFDHATALDNSQGFDISNAMFTGFVREPSFSTATPLSSSSNYLEQNLVSSTIKPTIGISTPIPDIIVGQSSFNNPVQAVLLPNKLQQNALNQYVQSTITPAVFAVTSRPNFSGSSTIDTSNIQKMLNQIQSSYPISQPVQSAQLNKNLFANLQPTTIRPFYEKLQQLNTKLKGNNGHFLASASLSVGQGINRHSNNDNSYSNNKRNNDDDSNESDGVRGNQQIARQNLNTFAQPTIVPAILHTGIGVIHNQNQPLIQSPFFITNPSQNTQLLKATNDAIQNSMKQLQYDIQNNRYQYAGIANTDSAGSFSNVNAINSLLAPIQKAQLPKLGAKNVEIVNPNLNANAYAINQIPAAIVTTPIPIFTTTGFIASKQPFASTAQEPSGSDRPIYNPINFVPNYDLIKSQSILNSNVVPIEQFNQKNLNSVPIIPGGHFYKHSQSAQIDLANKPKLSSDLEKYAEEMFKESLRTIYNTYKWNNDPRSSKNISLINTAELVKLRNELLRLKNSIKDLKGPNDVLEGHYTENKVRSVKPDFKHQANHHKNKPKINDYLTPPRPNSFISKSPYHDRPLKKRPGHGPRLNFNHDYTRPRLRQKFKLQGPEVQESPMVDSRFSIESEQEKPSYSQLDNRGSESYNYPTFTTSSPENNQVISTDNKLIGNGKYDINHRRTHNLMGLLMKNKQLPPGISQNSYSDVQDIRQLLNDENRRNEMQAYHEVLRSLQSKPDIQAPIFPLSRISTYDEVLKSFQPKTDRLAKIIPLSRISRNSYSEVNGNL